MDATSFPTGLKARAGARVPGPPSGALVLASCAVLFVGNALAAYNFGPIPIQWLAQFGWIALFCYIGLTRKLCKVPGIGVLVALFLWSLLVTVVNTWCYDYEGLQPELATAPYPIFVGLRFLTILSFVATIHVVFWLTRQGYEKEIIKFLTLAGSGVSLAAFYIYLAQVYGLPELPRNRMGTGGVEQITEFTYAFHRAMGTFREPSHLAEWLVVPFFVSFAYRPRALNIHAILIGSALLLTGSLTGMMGVAAGLAAALLVSGPLTRSSLGIGLRIALILGLGLLVFSLFAVSNQEAAPDLLHVIGDRLSPIFSDGGMRSTNRKYIYEYLDKNSVPLLGYGLGNADLLFTQYRGVELVSSYLSLYFNFLFATGILGLALVGLFLVFPLLRLVFLRRGRRSSVTLILAGYLGWLVMFAVHADEFTMMFGIVFALLSHAVQGKRASGSATAAWPGRLVAGRGICRQAGMKETCVS